MNALPRPSEQALQLFFATLASVQLGLGVWMFFWPHSFFTTIGAFGSYSRHYERDVATFYLAFGLGAAIAVRRSRWRVPVLAITTVQYALHSLNHAIDAGRANNSWAGPVDLVSLLLATIQFAAVLWLVLRYDRSGART